MVIENLMKDIIMTRWLLLPVAALLMNGCVQYPQPTYRPVVKKRPKPEIKTPKPPKVVHEFKEVEDNNFSPDYMYPETPKKTKKSTQSDCLPVTTVSRSECISMIGQEKFERYTQMLGGEEGAIKRCTLLKAMK